MFNIAALLALVLLLAMILGRLKRLDHYFYTPDSLCGPGMKYPPVPRTSRPTRKFRTGKRPK